MAKASPIQTSFTGGEFSPSLEGRVDLGKYASSAVQLDNFIPLAQGPLRRRSGTHYVAEVKDSSATTHLLRFEFSEFDAYMLEIGSGYIRFYTNHGQLLIDTPDAWQTTTSYALGDLVVESDVNYYCAEAHTSGTFATDLSSGYWHALTDDIYEIPTPWSTADLTNSNGTLRLRTVQTGDIVYIAHEDYPPHKLSRYGATDWRLEEVEFKGGPFNDVQPDLGVELYVSDRDGDITITSNTSFFTSDDVGKLIFIEEADDSYVKPWAPGQELSKSTSSSLGDNIFGLLRRNDGKTYRCTDSLQAPISSPPSIIRTGANAPVHTYGTAADGDGNSKGAGGADPTVSQEGVNWKYRDAGYGWARITALNSATSVDATVIQEFPDSLTDSNYASNRWAYSQWTEGNYPSQVAFYRERLVFATGQTLNFSVVGDFENFSAYNDSGETADDQAIKVEVLSDSVNQIQWLAPSDGLLIGTTGGEFLCSEVSRDQPLAPGNVKVSLQSGYGARSVIPLQVGESVVYAQKAGRRLRDLIYDFGTDKFKSTDLNVLADHIFGTSTEEGYSVTSRAVTNYLISSDGITGYPYWQTTAASYDNTSTDPLSPNGSDYSTKITWGSSYPQVYPHITNISNLSTDTTKEWFYSIYYADGYITWAPVGCPSSSTSAAIGTRFIDSGTVTWNYTEDPVTLVRTPTVSSSDGPAILDYGVEKINNTWFRGWVKYKVTQEMADTWGHYSSFLPQPQYNTVNIYGAQIEEGYTGQTGPSSYVSTTTSVTTAFITTGEKNGCIDLAYQQEPHSIIWAIRGTDGALIGFTFNKEQDVMGWHKHFMGGDGEVESIDCIPHPEGRQDDLWLIVNRTINGDTKRYVEYMERDYDSSQGDLAANAFFVDSGLTYAGAASDTISGLDHLEGMEVSVNANGAPHPNVTVSSGEITLNWETPYAHIGLPYTSTIKTQRLDAGGADGTSQGKTKRITKAVFRFSDTLAASVGPDTTITDDINFREDASSDDQAVVPFRGDKLVEWPNGYDFDGYVVVTQDEPVPLTLVAIMPQVHTQDR